MDGLDGIDDLFFPEDDVALAVDDEFVPQPRGLPLCPPPAPRAPFDGSEPTTGGSTSPGDVTDGEDDTDGEDGTDNTDGDNEGGAPVDIPEGTERVFVESLLGFGFFDPITRAPTQEEIDGLLVETTRFYTEALRAAYPNLNSFEATFVATNTDLTMQAADQTPVIVDFDANAFFDEGTTIPSAAEVFEVLEAANYQSELASFIHAKLLVYKPLCEFPRSHKIVLVLSSTFFF